MIQGCWLYNKLNPRLAESLVSESSDITPMMKGLVKVVTAPMFSVQVASPVQYPKTLPQNRSLDLTESVK